MSKLPYGFVPIPVANGIPQSVLDTPILHDGSQHDLLSGEIRCTLTALTPLLAANDQYEAQEVEGAVIVEKDNDRKPKTVKLPEDAKEDWGIAMPIAAGKHVIEPLRLADGRVAIAGTALKGMLRGSLSALLAAPMERVAERTYSYRPNLEFPRGGRLLREPRAAIVESWNEGKKGLELNSLPRHALGRIVFVYDEAFRKLESQLGQLRPGDLVNRTFTGVELYETRQHTWRLVPKPGRSQKLSTYRYYSYAGGIDGYGELARAFVQDRREKDAPVYKCVLVPDTCIDEGKPTEVPSAVLDMHEKTVAHLKDDREGHLRADHPLRKKLNLNLAKRGIEASRQAIQTKDHLVFVEWDNDKSEIVSIGQNYRYRWRFVDTVHTKGGKPRSILRSLPEEQWSDADGNPRQADGRPEKLSGARLLFGYAVSEENPGTVGIGKGNFQRLAGRLAFNIAVEQTSDGEDETRFLSWGQAIPLKILGQPKPSAVEEYLTQRPNPASLRKVRKDGGAYLSYGDVNGETTGDLRGRKFYRHQPNAFADECCYRACRREQGVVRPENETIEGDQASLARFISAPGTQFRFMLRFRDLRPWELGAVLVGLDPARLDGGETPPDEAVPQYALKLGHGQPLGLGSVIIAVDSLDLIDDIGQRRDGEAERQAALAEFRKKPLDPNVRESWLELHHYKGNTRYDYPFAAGRQGEMAIFNYYTDNRRKHSRDRRQH